MATYYSQKSGSVSDMTVWNTVRGGGGSAPASFNDLDDDALVIQGAALGHDVEWDGDASGWATGLAGLTIEGGASPGMLHCKYSADGTYYLKVKTGTTINGTTVTNRGRLLANSDGVWGNTGALPFGRKFTIEFLGTNGTAQILGANLDIQLYCTQPTNLCARTYGDKYYKTVGTSPTISVDYTTDTFTSSSAHGFSNGNAVMFLADAGGTLPAPLLPDTLYWIVNAATTTFKVAYYASGIVVDLTSNGSGTFGVYNGPGTGTTLNVLDDVTGDSAWVTTAGHNRVVLASAGPEAYNQLRTTLSTINAGTIALAANGLSTLRPNTRIWLMSRNILLKSNVTPEANMAVVDWGASTHTGSVLQCEFWQSAGSGTTFYGRATANGVGHTISGTISGYTTGCYFPNGFTISATCAANTAVINTTTAIQVNTLSGKFAGCNLTVNNGMLVSVTGEIYGCSTGMYNMTGGVFSGVMRGCSTGFDRCGSLLLSGSVYNPSTGATGCCGLLGTSTALISGVSNYGLQLASGFFAGALVGCATGLMYPTGLILSGSVSFSAAGVYAAPSAYATLTLRGAQFFNNTIDIAPSAAAPVLIDGYASGLRSAVQVANYKHVNSYTQDTPLRVQIVDLCDANGAVQPGYIGAWCPGGFTKTAAYSAGTHGTPPVTLAAVHVSTFEDSDRDTWVEFPIMAKAYQPVTVTVYHKVTSTTGWTTAPLIEICDANIGWKLANEVLASSSSFSVADTDWHTDRVSYLPTYDRPLVVRIRGCGGNAGGTGTGAMYWWQVIETSDRGAPTLGGRTSRRA